MPRKVSILDAFTRADAGSPGANWSQNPNHDGAANFDLVSNALKTNSYAGNWWNAASFDGTSLGLEMGVLVSTVPTTTGRLVGGGMVKTPSGASSTSNGYGWDWTRAATNDTYIITRITNGVPTTIASGSFTGHMPSNAIAMLRRAANGDITLLYDVGGTETVVATVNDTTHGGSGWYGYVEAYDNNVAVLDDFSMGTFAAGATYTKAGSGIIGP